MLCIRDMDLAKHIVKNVFLLTGEPKIGKTTVLKEIIDLVGNEKCGGFFTEEVRNENGRTGFKVISLDGKEDMLADIGLDSNLKVGRYNINLDVFEGIAVKSIYEAIKNKEYIIIDEIGPMQLYSVKFKDAVSEAINSGKTIIGTIVFRPYEWADDIKKNKNVELIELTLENRGDIPFKILKIEK